MRIFLALICVLIASFASANACSCIWPENMTVKKDYARKDVIFRGVFLEAKQFESERTSILDRVGKFEVLEILKGDVAVIADVYYSEDDGANCGLSFEAGKEYEIFAGINDENRIVTSDCSGTREACFRGKWSWEDYRKVAKKKR